MFARVRALIVIAAVVLGLTLVACDVKSPPVTSGGFTTQGKYPKTVVVGDEASLAAVVTSPGQTVLVDLEVYDPDRRQGVPALVEQPDVHDEPEAHVHDELVGARERAHRHVQHENRRLRAGMGPALPLERRRGNVLGHCRRRFHDLELDDHHDATTLPSGARCLALPAAWPAASFALGTADGPGGAAALAARGARSGSGTSTWPAE